MLVTGDASEDVHVTLTVLLSVIGALASSLLVFVALREFVTASSDLSGSFCSEGRSCVSTPSFCSTARLRISFAASRLCCFSRGELLAPILRQRVAPRMISKREELDFDIRQKSLRQRNRLRHLRRSLHQTQCTVVRGTRELVVHSRMIPSFRVAAISSATSIQSIILIIFTYVFRLRVVLLASLTAAQVYRATASIWIFHICFSVRSFSSLL